MKKILVIMSLVLSLLSPTIAQAEINYSRFQWPPQWNNNVDTRSLPLTDYAFDIVDTFNNGSTDLSFIRVPVHGVQPWCESMSDPKCVTLAKKLGWWIIRVLPPCTSPQQVSECIEGISVIDNKGVRTAYKFHSIYKKLVFPADAKNGLGEGSGSSLWVAEDNSKNDKGFLITVSGDAGAKYGQSSYPLTTFDATVTPYRTITGNFGPVEMKVVDNTLAVTGSTYGGAPSECIWVAEGKCGVQDDFPAELNIEFKIHLSSTLSSWVIGRLSNPDITIEKLGTLKGITYERVTVTAAPIKVPMIAGKVSVENASDAIKKDWATDYCPSCMHGISAINLESSSDQAFRYLKLFRNYLGEKSWVSIPYFSLSSMNPAERNVDRCKKQSSISGMVTTNASIYLGNPPTFDGSSLNYQVAALHYTEDGAILKGTYDLLMPTSTAQCLYGFKAPPVSATISITGESGSSTVATSTLSNSKGWLHLAAAGFTFSSPRISVNLIAPKAGK